jgi:hypothetical protein
VGDQVVSVYTASELQHEVELGTPHIVIQEHLDLRTLSPAPSASVSQELLVIRRTTQSIRVRPGPSLPATIRKSFVSGSFTFVLAVG